MADTYLTPKLFEFLEDLRANNDREWFQANRERYVEDVQEPALSFILAFADRLASLSPHFTADARPMGGSLFRIHRDTRFSSDKTPYKLNTGVHFRHEAAKDVHAPGYYLHLQPRECFAGVGIWHPPTKDAYRIRQHIAENPDAWVEATRSKPFEETWELTGDSLVKPPRGFPPDHPLIVDLKRKDFIASRPLSEAEVAAPSFLDDLAESFHRTTPFMRFLCEAMGVPF